MAGEDVLNVMRAELGRIAKERMEVPSRLAGSMDDAATSYIQNFPILTTPEEQRGLMGHYNRLIAQE